MIVTVKSWIVCQACQYIQFGILYMSLHCKWILTKLHITSWNIHRWIPDCMLIIKIFDTTRERFINEEERKETHDMLNWFCEIESQCKCIIYLIIYFNYQLKFVKLFTIHCNFNFQRNAFTKYIIKHLITVIQLFRFFFILFFQNQAKLVKLEIDFGVGRVHNVMSEIGFFL